jgi:hypothetical protein
MSLYVPLSDSFKSYGCLKLVNFSMVMLAWMGQDYPIGVKPEGFYFIAWIPNNKMKQKKNFKKNSEYCSNFENKERVKMAHPGFPVLNYFTLLRNIEADGNKSVYWRKWKVLY